MCSQWIIEQSERAEYQGNLYTYGNIGKERIGDIAKKLTKLLDIGIVAESRKDKAYEKYEDLADRNSWISRDEFIEKRNVEFAKIEETCVNKAKRDAFLRNFEVIV